MKWYIEYEDSFGWCPQNYIETNGKVAPKHYDTTGLAIIRVNDLLTNGCNICHDNHKAYRIVSTPIDKED